MKESEMQKRYLWFRGEGGGGREAFWSREKVMQGLKDSYGEKKKECSIKVEEVERFCEIFFLLK